MSSLVAVTGAEGFIGSHLTEMLVNAGHKVRAMVQYNSFGSNGWLETLKPETLEHIEIVMGDIRDAGSTFRFMQDAEVVYHLAALIAIPYSYQAPRSYLETNAGGTLNARFTALPEACQFMKPIRYRDNRLIRRPKLRRTKWLKAIISALNCPL
jgi:nucleoside-diphosphate-sugar epimerase